MIQPIRPNDATGVYRRMAGSVDGGVGAAGENAGGASSAVRRDQVTISDQAQALRRLIDKVQAQPELREARVAELRAQIAAGEYQVDGDALAALLVDEGLR
ncbi:MAG: flagellar biosynthesis anti-sigma factor FlgM [Dehalococcoidia bacterium]